RERQPRVRTSRRRRPSPKPRCNITSPIRSRASCPGQTDLCRPTTRRLRWNVGHRVTQATNDKQQLAPTVKAIEEQARQKPQEVMTDSGYCSEANLQYLEKKKIEGFIATDKESYRDRHQPGPRGPLPQGATRVDRMRRKLQTKVGA